jgi:hypothetical protein
MFEDAGGALTFHLQSHALVDQNRSKAGIHNSSKATAEAEENIFRKLWI